MKTLISEIRRLKLAHGNRINSIEKKKEKLAIIRRQLDAAYAHVGIMTLPRIERLEAVQAKMEGVW